MQNSVVQVAEFTIILSTTIDMHTFLLFLLSFLSLLYPFFPFLSHFSFMLFSCSLTYSFFPCITFFLSFLLLLLLFVFIFFIFSDAITSYWLLPSLFSFLFPSTKSFISQFKSCLFFATCYILIILS